MSLISIDFTLNFNNKVEFGSPVEIEMIYVPVDYSPQTNSPHKLQQIYGDENWWLDIPIN